MSSELYSIGDEAPQTSSSMITDIEKENSSLLAFGHGLFQRCGLTLHMFQAYSPHGHRNYDHSDSRKRLLADHYVSIGVEISPPDNYNGTIKQFVALLCKFLPSVEFIYSIMNGQSEVLLESSPASNPLIDTEVSADMVGMKCAGSNHVLQETKSGLMVCMCIMLKTSPEFYNIPLTFQMLLQLELKQGKPFNQRLVMDTEEMNVRLLLDLNRYRPPRVPHRVVSLPMILEQPISVHCRAREMTVDCSIIMIELRNLHQCMDLIVNDVTFHILRTASDTTHKNYDRELDILTNGSDSQQAVDKKWVPNDLFTFEHIEQRQSNHNPGDVNTRLQIVTISPGETYTVLFKTRCHLDELIELKGYSSNIPHALLGTGVFITPLTIDYALHLSNDTHDFDKNTDDAMNLLQEFAHRQSLGTDRLQTRSIDYRLHWSIGIDERERIMNISQCSGSKSRNITLLRSAGDDMVSLPICISCEVQSLPPTEPLVALGQTFTLKLCVRNNSNNHTLLSPCLLMDECESNLGNGDFLFNDTSICLRDLPPGEAVAAEVRVLPLSLGCIRIHGIFLQIDHVIINGTGGSEEIARKQHQIYQMLKPIEVMVKEL